MKHACWFGVVALAATLSVSATAQETPSEQELYRQKIDALERKVEQLERATRENVGASEQAIENVTKRLAKQQEKPTDILTSWKDGLNFQSRDKSFIMHIGGRLHYDFAWYGEDSQTRQYVVPATGKALGDQLDGTELRRLRFQIDGTIFNNVFFKIEPDFAGSEKAVQKDVDEGGTKKISATTMKTGTVALKSAYIGLKDTIPFMSIQAGHFNEPFSLEELTSDNYGTFMERALPNALVPSYNVGVQVSNPILGDRATWAAGVFRETDDRGYGQSEGGANFTGRITALPWYEADGARLLHLGMSASERNPRAGVQYSSRPETHLTSKYLDTGLLDSDNALLLGGEAALVYGPLSLQGEYVQSQVKRDAADDVTFNGWYAQASCFLTGERRPYKKSAGVFDRVRPLANLGKKSDGSKGWGAVELAARYSSLDLNDSDVRGGKLADTTVGVNWYLNPNVRLMADYTLAELSDNDDSEGGETGIFGMRLQIDF